MTDEEVNARARRCLQSLALGGASGDPSRLSAGDFTPIMRRGLERLIAQTPHDNRLQPEDVERASYRLFDRKLFPGLRAFLHHVDAWGKKMIQLTALDDDGTVCDFAFLEDVTRLDLPYLKGGPGLGRYPWHNVAMFSMNYKVNALLPQCDGISLRTRRLGDTMEATIKWSRERFSAMSAGDAKSLMDDLTAIVRNALLLMFANIRPNAVRILLIESPDEPRSTQMFGIGRVPQELQLADRLVELPL